MPTTVAADVERLAQRQRSRIQRLSLAVKVVLARQWRRLDPSAPTRSWDAGLARESFIAVSGGQLAAAKLATPFVASAMELQDFDPDNVDGEFDPESLAGMASDGRSLASLLYQPVFDVESRLAAGENPAYALRVGFGDMERIVETQVADAARVGIGVASNANRDVKKYVRTLTPPSCARCAILAGKETTVERPFQRHPRCLLPGTWVSGPATLAATRRWFEGELVIIRTAGGELLTITGNHPVLTDQGWTPAHLVQEGDHCVRSILDQGATPLVVPDKRQVPTPIEDVWRAHSVAGFDTVPSTAEDFHGDGGHGEVDVVSADRQLWDRCEAALDQPARQAFLARGVESSGVLHSQRVPLLEFFGMRHATNGVVGGGRLTTPCLRCHPGGSHQPSLTGVADRHTCALQDASDDVARDAVLLREGIFADAIEVPGDDGRLNLRRELASRWDAPAGSLTVENSVAYASRGTDLLQRLAGQVELDRVVEVDRIGWSGHVYNLTSAEGWFTADTLIVSNCDCINTPVGDPRLARELVRNPLGYFESLSAAEQNRIFTKAGAAAIREGSDIFQVVNARRGMSTTGSWVQRLEGPEREGRIDLRLTRRGSITSGQFTTEGMTRRGLANQGLRKTPGALRLTPEAIYALASDRDEILRLLRRFGYLV